MRDSHCRWEPQLQFLQQNRLMLRVSAMIGIIIYGLCVFGADGTPNAYGAIFCL